MIDTKHIIGFLLNTKIISDSPLKSDMYSAREIGEYRAEIIKRLENYERIKKEIKKLIDDCHKI